jgi:putative ABC transport system permease protein
MRSSLTALGVAMAVSSFIVLVSLSRGVENAWKRSLEERGVHMLAISREAVELLTATLDEDLAGRIAMVPGVADVAGELVNLVKIEDNVHVVMRGWPDGSFLWDTLRLEEGDIPKPDDGMGVVIGRTLSTALAAGIGDPLVFMGHEFKIVGISVSAGVMNDGAVIMRLGTLQKVFQRRNRVTTFMLRLRTPGNRQAVEETKRRLCEQLPALSFVVTRDIADNSDILQVLRASAWSVSLVAIITALVFILNTLLMSVTERTREIGVLSAIGWQPSRVLTMIVIEGMALAAVGSVAGAAIGIAGVHWLAQLPKLRSMCEIVVTCRLLAETAAASVFLGAAGSLYPALRALRLRPVDALKYE